MKMLHVAEMGIYLSTRADMSEINLRDLHIFTTESDTNSLAIKTDGMQGYMTVEEAVELKEYLISWLHDFD